MKEQSKQWTVKDKLVLKKAKTVKSAGKIMATVLWDGHGIILIDYLEQGKIITGQYYVLLLVWKCQAVKKKGPNLNKKKFFSIMIMKEVKTCTISKAKIEELKFELMDDLTFPIRQTFIQYYNCTFFFF